VSHWGGRYIWQLADADELVTCWKTTPKSDPTREELKLLQAFTARYGKRPFANLHKGNPLGCNVVFARLLSSMPLA